MRILILGSEGKSTVQRSWIEEEFDANIQLCSDKKELKHFLTRSHWELVVMNLDGRFYPEEILKILENSRSRPAIIAISENSDNGAIEAMRLGVADYLVAPVEKPTLLRSIHRIIAENPGWQKASESNTQNGNGVVRTILTEEVLFEGSAKMLAVKHVVDKIIDTDLPILITGESGTGKEMVAHYIQAHSQRSGPFVRVNCAAIPSELLESELFGYERGAFTGAYRRKPGKFEAADSGYLFLDEISELSYPLQSKLLHVLQDGTVSTLGSTREIPVDVRILAATNQNLEDCVRKGTFRDDLFFRLNVVHLNIPPLRERLDHLAVLIDYFCEKFAIQYDKQPVQLSPEARSFLYTYPWPGNIRELENAIRRATILGVDNFLNNLSGGHLQPVTGKVDTALTDVGLVDSKYPTSFVNRTPDKNDVPGKPGRQSPFEADMSLKKIAKIAALEAEREAIASVLQQTRWNRKKTAKILDISYKTLLTKIKETGLDEN